jgi:hypothetical protein
MYAIVAESGQSTWSRVVVSMGDLAPEAWADSLEDLIGSG